MLFQDENSPTSKLHRLLAESRQMVQNLEQSTIATPPAVRLKYNLYILDNSTNSKLFFIDVY